MDEKVRPSGEGAPKPFLRGHRRSSSSPAVLHQLAALVEDACEEEAASKAPDERPFDWLNAIHIKRERQLALCRKRSSEAEEPRTPDRAFADLESPTTPNTPNTPSTPLTSLASAQFGRADSSLPSPTTATPGDVAMPLRTPMARMLPTPLGQTRSASHEDLRNPRSALASRHPRSEDDSSRRLRHVRFSLPAIDAAESPLS